MGFDFTFDYPSLGIKEQDYLKELGYGNKEPPKQVVDILHFYDQGFRDNLKLSCAFIIIDGKCTGSSIVLKENVLHVGNVLGRLLKGSEHFAVFAATAGMYFQEYYDEMEKGDNMLQLFILDVMGTCIVEKTGDLMEQYLEQEMELKRHTARFSPGYCGWALTEQKEIFRLLGKYRCGISLEETCLMYPLKSISGVIGIGNEVVERKYGCDICSLTTCYKRNNRKKYYDTYK